MTVLTHREAAAFLKVNQATLRKLRRSGKIHGQQVGGQYRYVQEQLEAYLLGKSPSEEPARKAVDGPGRLVRHRGFYRG